MIIPPGVYAIRCGGFPERGSRLTAFVTGSVILGLAGGLKQNGTLEFRAQQYLAQVGHVSSFASNTGPSVQDLIHSPDADRTTHP